MILKGNQRAGGGQLARHLLNDRDNDHISIHDLRGFISEDLNGAFTEAFAVSQGTRCKQFLFSLSLSPPENARVPVGVFEAAIKKIEERLGLANQPRAIVFHEKEGRRHAHCVWSRIDAAEMKAINLPHYKMRLRDISRQLFLDNNWRMPRGLQNSQERSPFGYSQAEHQQAKRTESNASAIKKVFKNCWAASDSAASFSHALEQYGYHLAKGDRRGHVAVNSDGEIFAISRWLDLKAKDLRAKLGEAAPLPSVEEAKARLEQKYNDNYLKKINEIERKNQERQGALSNRRAVMVAKQRTERKRLREKQTARKNEENKARAALLPTGLKALWFRVTGKYHKIVEYNEIQKLRCDERDGFELQKLIELQLKERRTLQHEIRQLRYLEMVTRKSLINDQGRLDDLSVSNRKFATPRSRKQVVVKGKNLQTRTP